MTKAAMERFEEGARQAEASAKTHEAVAQEKEAMVRLMEAEAKELEAQAREKEAEARRKDEEANKIKEEARRLEEKVRQSLMEVDRIRQAEASTKGQNEREFQKRRDAIDVLEDELRQKLAVVREREEDQQRRELALREMEKLYGVANEPSTIKDFDFSNHPNSGILLTQKHPGFETNEG